MNNDRIPQNYSLCISQQEIQQMVADVASVIVDWLEEKEQELEGQVLVIPIMRGALFFFSDLIRLIPFSVEVAPIRAQAYEASENALAEGPVKMSLEQVDVVGRHILLVDDICDSGKTLKALTERLNRMGAAEVRSAVLVKRNVPNSQFDPDFVGIHYQGAEWLVGYGMDDSQHWRNLPDIYVIEQS